AAIFNLEGKHSTEHRHLAPGDFTSGMGTQSRIMHVLNLSMFGEKFRDLNPVFRVCPHSPRQGAHSTQNQPAIERRGDRPAGILDGPNELKKFTVLLCDNDPASYIAMPAEVFRGRMQNQIGAQLEGTL